MKSLEVLAPAKINLYLHVTGRVSNGYHTLDSLVSFADIGDKIYITPSESFKFSVSGEFAQDFTEEELKSSPDSKNIMVQAVWSMSQLLNTTPSFNIELEKKLPLASGMGGGSSDAAAVVWALCELWDVSLALPQLPGLLFSLGADVPACFSCRPCRIQGVGDVFEYAPFDEDISVVLVNSLKHLSTEKVFQTYGGAYKSPLTMPLKFGSLQEFCEFLDYQENSLMPAALSVLPELHDVISSLESTENCLLSRMSGSGATCFGLYESEAHAREAKSKIKQKHKNWWVEQGTLNRPQRY
jgi:4-diphosphocytidyl-2-C-methyl-D-erythritol kinase